MKCRATKTNGEPCQAYAVSASEYCYMHDPSLAADRAKARKLGGYNRRAGRGHDWGGMPEKVRTLQDVLTVLDFCLADLVFLENSISRARAIIALAGEYRQAIQTGELENRLEQVEAVLSEFREKTR